MECYEDQILFVKTVRRLYRINLKNSKSYDGYCVYEKLQQAMEVLEFGGSPYPPGMSILKMNNDKVYLLREEDSSLSYVYEFHAANNSLAVSKTISSLPLRLPRGSIVDIIEGKVYVLREIGGYDIVMESPSFVELDTSTVPANWEPLPEPPFYQDREVDYEHLEGYFVIDHMLYVMNGYLQYCFDTRIRQWSECKICSSYPFPSHGIQVDNDIILDLLSMEYLCWMKAKLCGYLFNCFSLVGYQEVDIEDVGFFPGIRLISCGLIGLEDKNNMCVIATGRMDSDTPDGLGVLCICIFELHRIQSSPIGAMNNTFFSVSVKKQSIFRTDPDLSPLIEGGFLLKVPQNEEANGILDQDSVEEPAASYASLKQLNMP